MKWGSVIPNNVRNRQFAEDALTTRTRVEIAALRSQ